MITAAGEKMSWPNRLIRAPEIFVAFFSFIYHFVWEFLQVPTYAGMADLRHWEGVKICTEATVGDVGFALTAFWVASAVARTRHWIQAPSAGSVLAFLAVGIGLTIGFEYYYVEISNRWTYSEIMPRVPPFGTGLSPLVQWVVIPVLVIVTVGRIGLRSESVSA